MPCTRTGDTGLENTEIIYADGIAANEHNCGENAKLNFRGLTNWGQEPIVNDLTADADSIVVVALMQVCSTPSPPPVGANTIPFTLTPDSAAVINGDATIDVASTAKSPTPVSMVGRTVWTPTVAPAGIIYKNVLNLFEFEVDVPDGFFGGIKLVLTNLAFGSGEIVDFCHFALIKVGDNLPCVNMVNDVIVANVTEATTPDG